jgi:Rrf2 family nitric oxide-sensitive transcriptional repressor
MRLTQHTDYALRVLIYLAVRDGQRVTIQEIAEAYGISRNHLMKVVQRLGALGHIRTVRGKRGGMLLAKPANRLKIGAVVRDMEESMAMAECFSAGGTCRISEVCRLQGALSDALSSFLRVLDRYTLADMAGNPAAIAAALGLPPRSVSAAGARTALPAVR